MTRRRGKFPIAVSAVFVSITSFLIGTAIFWIFDFQAWSLIMAVAGAGLTGFVLAWLVTEPLPPEPLATEGPQPIAWEGSVRDDLSSEEADTSPIQVTSIDPEIEALLGYPLGEWAQSDLFGKVHPHDRDRVVSAAWDVVRRGGSARVEYRIRTIDEDVRWVENSFEALSRVGRTGRAPDKGEMRGGRATTLRGQMLDITERQMTERRLDALLAVNQAIAESETLSEAAAKIIQAVCRALRWQVGALWTLDESGERLSCLEIWQVPGSNLDIFIKVAKETQFPPGVGLPGRVWEEGSPTWISDVVIDLNFPRAPQAKHAGLRAGFGFPIFSGRKFLGVFEFFSVEFQRPDEELLEMMGGIGFQIGQTMERKKIQEQLEFQRALLERQNEATIDAILVVSPEGTVLSTNSKLMEMFDIPEEAMAPGNDDEYIRRILAKLKEPEDGLKTIAGLFESNESEARVEVNLVDEKVLDMWSVPVLTKEGSLLGRAWYFRDVTEQRRSEESLRQSRDRLQLLYTLGRELAASLSFEDSLSRFAEILVPALADWCTLDIVGPEGSITRTAVRHADPAKEALAQELIGYKVDPAGNEPVAESVRTGQTLVRTNAGKHDESAFDGAGLETFKDLGDSSTIVAALIARGRTIGAMTLARGAESPPYSEDEVTLAEAISRRAALAIDNIRLYEDKSRIAQTLQKSLLPPSLPAIPGLEVAARYSSAGEGEVGGDFYDVFQYGPKRWAAVIGDVVGKGAEAASLTALVRYTLRSEAMQEREPARLIASINEAMINQRDAPPLCTVAYLRIDLSKTGPYVSIVRAGHPPPLLLKKGGTVEELGETGPALGLAAEGTWAEDHILLEEGDSILLYTDGITEARQADELFGEQRLREAAATLAGLSADAIADSIEKSVLSFSAGHLRDDVALLVISARPA